MMTKVRLRLISPVWPWFLAWFAVGAMYAFGALGALTIGIFVLPVALAATFLLARRGHASDEIFGLVSGLGIPLLYVAYLNRAGPGTVCTNGGRECTDEWSPWPWLLVGVAVLVAGLVMFMVRSQRRQT